MTTRFIQRRHHLIVRAAAQRAMLSQQIQDWRRPLELADRALVIARYFKTHPLLLSLPLGLFAFRRPRVLLRWFNRGWLAREVLRKLFIR
jgi:YqjK-like protein